MTLFAAFLLHESRAHDPMLKLDLFKSRNFAVGKIETLALYGGLSALFCFLVLYLQQVAGYTKLELCRGVSLAWRRLLLCVEHPSEQEPRRGARSGD